MCLFTLVGSPVGSGYISTFLFSVVMRFVKSLMESETSFPASIVAKSRLELQKYTCGRSDDSDKSHDSSCSITCPLIWLRVKVEFTFTIKSPPMPKKIVADLGFPRRVHLMFRTLVDSITICCTVCTCMHSCARRRWISYGILRRNLTYWKVLRDRVSPLWDSPQHQLPTTASCICFDQ